MAEGPKRFDSQLGAKTAAFIDAVTGMKKTDGDAITQSFDPMDVLPVERGAKLLTGVAKGAAARMRKASLNLPSKFSVFTADNPAAKMLSAEENLARKAQLVRELEERGIPYREAKGQYSESFDNPENSILIPHGEGVDESVVNELGKKYGQESVVHHADGKNKLQYVTGEKAGHYNVGEGVTIAPNAKNYYTELDGNRFNLGLEFDTLHPPKAPESTIRVSDKLSDLTGQGEELLQRQDGTVAAKFYDGNVMKPAPVANAADPTLITAPKEQLVHYSKHPGEIKELDPAYMGTGSAGKEMQRGVPIQPRTSYYKAGTAPESVVADPAVNVHYVDAPSPEQIVDLSDPRLRVEGAWNDATDLENRAKELGFKGFTNKDGPLPNAVNLLEKTPVTKSMPIDRDKLKKGEWYAAGGMVAGGAVPMADGGMTQAPMLQMPPGSTPPPPGLVEDLMGLTPAQQPSSDPLANTPPPPGLEAAIAPQMLQAEYGTPGQQLLAGVEGIGQGLAGPVFTAAELATGLTTPEAMRKREQANPGTSMGSQALGFIGPAVASGGATALGRAGVAGAAKIAPTLGKIAGATQLGLLERGGEMAASQISNKLAKDFVKEAFIGGLFLGGEELNRAFKEDPEQPAGSAIAHIGLASVASGVFGAGIGAAMRGLKGGVAEAPKMAAPLVSQADAPLMERGDLATLVKHDASFTAKEKEGILSQLKNYLTKRKPNADSIERVAKENDLPVLEGMVLGAEIIQRGEDTLLTGGNTFSANRRTMLYDEAHKKAQSILDAATGAESALSKAQVGEIVGTGLTAKIKEEGAVSSRMFNAIKQRTDIIPVDELSIPFIKAELSKIPEYRVSPSSPQGQLGKRILNDLENVKTVDDLKVLKSSIHDSLPATASPGERRMAAILGDNLKKLEEDSIIQHALRTARTPEELAEAQALPAALKAARDTYRPYIQKIEKLAKQLGKSRVHGAQDAINFIDNLDYEQLSSRLFNKNKSEFIGWFAKEFPEEMQVLRQYEKGKLREAGMRQGEFSPLTYFNAYNKLEPEIQASLFSKAEMKKIADMEEYLRSFPKRFNPSGTAAAINLRQSFQPKALGLINAQDFAIEKFIKMAGASPEAANAAALGKATAAGQKLMERSVAAVMDGSKKLPAAIIPIAAHRDKLARIVLDYQAHPEKMLAANDNNPVPEYQQSFAATTQRAVMYLNSVRPNNEPQSPLDPKMPLNDVQKDDYDRALQIAEQPLAILGHMANGTMTPKDVQALQAIHPNVYKALAERMIAGIMEKQQKKQEIPYTARMQMSMFLSTPLDSTMRPMSIMGAQMKSGRNEPETPQMPAQGGKKLTAASANGLSKMSKSYQTAIQARESARGGK
jgi:hypothetical protein